MLFNDWLIVWRANRKNQCIKMQRRGKWKWYCHTGKLLSRSCQLSADLKDGWWCQVEAVLCLWEGGGDGGHREGAHEEARRSKVKGPVQVEQLPRWCLQDCLQTVWKSFTTPEDEESHKRKAWDGNHRLQNQFQPGNTGIVSDLYPTWAKESKMLFDQNFFDLEEKVFHECGVCGEPVISFFL